jgi:hypothetical protein
MDNRKYIGMDVHQASISVAVRDADGKLLMECIIETKAAIILEFIQGLRGSSWITFEEGTSAAWLYDLLKPNVAKVVVCDPRKNALLKAGNKNDRVDARKLSDLLRAGLLTPVYHGESGVRTLQELSRSYLTITKDLTRVMNRSRGYIEAGRFPARVKRSIPHATAVLGWKNYRNRGFAAAPSGSTNSWTHWSNYGVRCGESCWRKARGIPPASCSGRSRGWARFGWPWRSL